MLIRKLLSLGCIGALTLFAHCKKSSASGLVFTGTIAVAACGIVVIDVDGKTGTGNGVVWKENPGINHTNAVSVKNICYIFNQQLNAGTRISFRISDTDISNSGNCAITECYLASPDSRIFVYDVVKL